MSTIEAKIRTARQIGLAINTAELRSVENLERSVAVIQRVLEAKKEHKLPPLFGADALAEATLAAHSFARGHRALAACHKHLVADQDMFGVPRLTGDTHPCPTFRPRGEDGGLALVA